MKRIVLYIFLLFFPILSVVFVNEITKTVISKNDYKKYTIKTINSGFKNAKKCSWACHNNTNFCKKNHVKLLANHFDKTDPFYFGIVTSLKATGNYKLANIILLVIVFPLIFYILLVKCIQIQYKINKHLKND